MSAIAVTAGCKYWLHSSLSSVCLSVCRWSCVWLMCHTHTSQVDTGLYSNRCDIIKLYECPHGGIRTLLLYSQNNLSVSVCLSAWLSLRMFVWPVKFYNLCAVVLWDTCDQFADHLARSWGAVMSASPAGWRPPAPQPRPSLYCACLSVLLSVKHVNRGVRG